MKELLQKAKLLQQKQDLLLKDMLKELTEDSDFHSISRLSNNVNRYLNLENTKNIYLDIISKYEGTT